MKITKKKIIGLSMVFTSLAIPTTILILSGYLYVVIWISVFVILLAMTVIGAILTID